MVAQSRPWSEVLAEIADVRSHRGQRHPLAALLAWAGSARWCGARRYPAIAEWGRHQGGRLPHAWGCTRPSPWAATLQRGGRHVDRDVCAAQLGAWAAGLLAGRPESPDTVAGMAVDGKTRRGSRQPGAPGAPLLSALAHRVGLTLAPHAVADQTHASPVVLELRRQGGLAGRVVTLDAVVPQRAITRQVVEAGGNSVLDVKDPQPQWREARATVGVQAPRADGLRTVAETVDVGHGRIAQRRLQTRAVLADESAWPGLAPVCRRTRQVIRTKTGEVRAAVVLGLTRLPPERAAAARWLALVRGPWHSEHQSPGVREVTLDAERSQVRCGHIPQVMAGLRNTVLGLMRWAGYTHMAAACRRCAAQPALARELIGMRLEN